MRAKEILPHLTQHAEVDFLVSGKNAELDLEHPIKHDLRGVTIQYTPEGAIDYIKTASELKLMRFLYDVCNVRCKDYDVVITDFEPVAAWAAKRSRVPSVQLSHQAAFLSPNTPRPAKKDLAFEQVLRLTAPAGEHIGFHYQEYDSFIHTPIIRQKVRELEVSEAGHYTVYLPAYEPNVLVDRLSKINTDWHVFTKHTDSIQTEKNVVFHPLSEQGFLDSLASSSGVLCGAGFQTSSEALFLGKKLLVVPIEGQYEQHCNAAALEDLGVPWVPSLRDASMLLIDEWVQNGTAISLDFPDKTKAIVDELAAKYIDK